MTKIQGHLVDIERQSIYDAEISTDNGVITSILPCTTPLPADAPFVMPGFVDSHIHIESTLLTPSHFASLALAHGTVAIVADPHEIANVLGVDGVRFMMEDGADIPFGFHFCVPSCVPSTPFETAGAAINADDVELLMDNPRVVGLAEMMNVPGVLFEDAEVKRKIAVAKRFNKVIDGHAPMLSGKDLDKYIQSGISTDHECTTIDEAVEKINKGMSVLIREGSAACNYSDLAPLLNDYPDSLMFCTDDIYPDELLLGHINLLVRRAVQDGYPLWNVLKSACVNPVHHYGLSTGLLRPNDSADFILVNNLTDFNVLATYYRGVEVFNADAGIGALAAGGRVPVAGDVPNRFNAQPVKASDLKAELEGNTVRVITATDGQLLTGCKEVTIPIDPNADILKLVVYNRYQKAAPQVAFIQGFGLSRGAFGATIAHDCHNIIAVGRTDDDLVTVINHLIESRGGIAATDGRDLVSLPLPVAGLMSDEDPQKVAVQLRTLKAMVKGLGCDMSAPFMTLSFMALPVIPALKLTDKGLFDGTKFQFTALSYNA